MEPVSLALPTAAPGTLRWFTANRYGRKDAMPKVYIQAGIHADEPPASLVACHLVDLLDAAEQAGAVLGEITLVPLANPIGLTSVIMGTHHGRHHGTGQNYNRYWPDVSGLVLERVHDRLGPDAGSNMSLVRGAVAEELDRFTPFDEVQSLQLMLMRLAVDADVILDLHTAAEAELYIHADVADRDNAVELAGQLGASVVILEQGALGGTFQQIAARPYRRLKNEAQEKPIEAPFLATIEHRGHTDTSDDLAHRDATAICRFLAHRGAIAGEPEEPPGFAGIVTSIDAVETLSAPVGGIIVFKKDLGETVEPGEPVVQIVDPLAQCGQHRVTVAASTAGRLFARSYQRLAWPGAPLVSIAGAKGQVAGPDGAARA